MDKKNVYKYLPAIAACCILAGIVIGIYAGRNSTPRQVVINYDTDNKMNELLALIHSEYVDTLNYIQLVEELMPKILTELDPHSTYIPSEDLEETTADLRGSFSGIGVQFTIQEDTIHINNVIKGGPSERIGLMAGDRIVTIDDSLYVGKKINNNDAMKRLKGEKGSEVRLGIARRGEKELLHFTIIRGDIPVKSVDAAYMIDNKYGFIKINKFGETTFAEMMVAIARFHQANMKGLIVDLRGNLGGYMIAAIQMANQFLQAGEMIVYTEGVHQSRFEESANGLGSCQETPLIVLIDETSASSSEIFAGAIQDNDRGTIIGRRSFGKGLVQQMFNFSDGSAVRLTIARYYTPSGRCIQKPYEKGDDSDYEMDILSRYEHGEFFSQDSIKQNEQETYKTRIGRTVYGGGGIMPDLFVPSDTAGSTSYYTTAATRGLLIRFCYRYTDNNRNELQKYGTMESMLAYLKTQPLLEQFITFAANNGLKPRNNQIAKSRNILIRTLYAYIIYDMLSMEEHIKFLNIEDPTVQKAIEVLNDDKAFPQLAETSAETGNNNTEE